jgi:hypothetical protein
MLHRGAALLRSTPLDAGREKSGNEGFYAPQTADFLSVFFRLFGVTEGNGGRMVGRCVYRESCVKWRAHISFRVACRCAHTVDPRCSSRSRHGASSMGRVFGRVGRRRMSGPAKETSGRQEISHK